MRRYITRGTLLCAVLPLSLLAGGCADLRPIGQPGYDQFKAGEYEKADVSFHRDMDRYPDSTIAQFNMGDAYHHDGNADKADGMFHQVAANGKNFVPDKILEVGGENHENVTAREVACRHLHEDHQLDANCGDQMVAVVTPPAAVEETPPAVEAEATAPPPPVYKRKQDRN